VGALGFDCENSVASSCDTWIGKLLSFFVDALSLTNRRASLTCIFNVNPESEMSLRQGYQCNCSQCQTWIDRWSKELDAFIVILTMMREENKDLFQTCERLRAQHPDILQLHHVTIEKQCSDCKNGKDNPGADLADSD